jgi:hypothetical protein
MHSQLYLEWVADTEQKGLTSTQAEFAEFLIEHADKLKQIGDLESVFISVRDWLKKEAFRNNEHLK